MPDLITTPAQHDDIVRKVTEQGIINPNPNDIDVRDSGDALDKLAAERTKSKENEPPVVESPPAAPAEPDPEAKAEAEKTKAEAAERDALLKKSDDYFKDTPQLPQGASPKSTEAFATIKVKAAQEIAARETELEKIRKENADLKARVEGTKPLTPDVEKEIESLRDFRNRLDVEADPKFREFNTKIASTQEFIYAQLRKSPVVTDEVISEIKKYGGPEKVHLAKLFEKIGDPTLQRIVESKVAEIEQISWAKEEAVKSAKANVKQYLVERAKEAEQAATIHQEATNKELTKIFNENPGLAWLRTEAAIDPKADEATRKNAEGFNAFRKEVSAQIAEAAKDDSPFMRAVQLAGMANLLYVQRLYTDARAKLESIDSTHKAAIESKDKEIAELTTKLSKYKSSSMSRLNDTGAPPNGNLPGKTPDVDLRPAGDALDAAAKQIMENRRARGQ